MVESGKERAPVFSYVKSRGLYAGISILGQVFVGESSCGAHMVGE